MLEIGTFLMSLSHSDTPVFVISAPSNAFQTSGQISSRTSPGLVAAFAFMKDTIAVGKAGHDERTIAELAALLGEIAGVDQRTICLGSKADDMPPRAWFPFRDFPCLMDPTRILRETSWGPKAGLRERFAETLAHYSRDALVAAYSPTDAEARLLTKVSADAD